MPYERKGKCVYKKPSGKKVGCSDTVAKAKKYIQALYASELNESLPNTISPEEQAKIKEFMAEQLFARITTMWFVNQKPGEYNPVHIHTNCKVSSVCYLKTPKQQVIDRKHHYKTDGK